MKKSFVLLTSIMLSGCYLGGSTKAIDTPWFSGESEKTPRLFMDCVLNSWSKDSPTPIDAKPTATGYTARIIDTVDGEVMVLAVHTAKRGTGSTFTFQKQSYQNDYETAVFDCK